MDNDKTHDARIALACLDLTSLNDHDDAAAIDALCVKAQGPAGPPAALCVWPRFVAQARAALPPSIKVAAVANFPDGALDSGRALRDAHAILEAGGDEVDLVLPWRSLAAGDAVGAAGLVAQVRAACAGKTLKLIIESGELRSPQWIREACRIGLDAGVDFLKTSSGKTSTGATPDAARLMLESIAGHPRREAVGFKASGGVRTVADAAIYIALVRELLGDAAITPLRLRFGASGLLADIESLLLLHGEGAGNTSAPRDY